MSSANIGWLFYKDYFKNVDYSDLKNKKNEDIIKEKVQNIILQTPQIVELSEDDMLGNIHFQATTIYPGLLLGSGNAHELPSIEGQAILGFHFDYTSGLPVIQGSSIKGVLRSAFKHPDFIKELLNDHNLDVKGLEKELFDNGDIFHDASVIKADSFNKILGDDFLAPHGSDPLKNPIPLRFIKVLPNVTFRFDFELSDGLLDKQKKSKLFQEILKNLGLGAKTNVGYGKFEAFTSFKSEVEKEDEKFELILNSDNPQTIQNFIISNPNHPRVIELENKIRVIEESQKQNKFAKINDDAQKAFDGAIGQKDKNKRKQYLQSWIKKWEEPKNNEGSSYILDLIEIAKKENK